MASLQIRKLPPILQEIAEQELNETPQAIVSGLESLKIWLLQQSHLKTRTDDQFLVAFLRSSKHSIERAKEKLDAYYTIRTAFPEVFSHQDPNNKSIKNVMNLGISIYLPEPHPNGNRIILNCLSGYDPNEVLLNDIIKFSFMRSDLAMITDDNLIIAGQIVIFDMKGSSGFISQLTPIFLKKLAKTMQEGYPYRQKGIHFVNAPKIFDVIFKIFYNFLNEKFRKRTFVHSNLESLHEHVPKDLLPFEYGGEMGTIQTLANKSSEKCLEYRDWFLENEKYKTDESKRIGPSKYSDLCGTEGTFRKLEVD